MTQTIELPDLWLLIAPCGCIDGYMRAVSPGRDPYLTAESAWRQFEPRKRARDKAAKNGYVCRGGDYAEWYDGPHSDCPHDPKWGIPATSSATPEGNQDA